MTNLQADVKTGLLYFYNDIFYTYQVLKFLDKYIILDYVYLIHRCYIMTVFDIKINISYYYNYNHPAGTGVGVSVGGTVVILAPTEPSLNIVKTSQPFGSFINIIRSL